MGRKKIMLIILALVVIVIIGYLIILLNTNSVIIEAKKVFLNGESTPNNLLSRYNFLSGYPDNQIEDVTFFLVRTFVWHDFRDGYMNVRYTYIAKDSEGQIITGAMWVSAKWIIKKVNGVWRVVDIIEQP